MKQTIKSGFVVVGKKGKVIAIMFDDTVLGNIRFTNKEAKTTTEKVYPVEIKYPAQSQEPTTP